MIQLPPYSILNRRPDKKDILCYALGDVPHPPYTWEKFDDCKLRNVPSDTPTYMSMPNPEDWADQLLIFDALILFKHRGPSSEVYNIVGFVMESRRDYKTLLGYAFLSTPAVLKYGDVVRLGFQCSVTNIVVSGESGA